MGAAKGDGRGALGRAGEAFAQEVLERHGYRIIDTNVRFGKNSGLVGELDIIAWDGPTLCFVEVKTRRGNSPDISPGAAVTPAKQRQIALLALAYANRHGLLTEEENDGIPLRFDVVAVTMTPGEGGRVRRTDILRGAFLAPDDLIDG